MNVFPDERSLLVILNRQQYDLLLRQADSGDVYAEGLITRWRGLMQDLVTWEQNRDTSRAFVIVTGELNEGYSIHGLEVFQTYNAALKAAELLMPSYEGWVSQESDFTLGDGEMPYKAWLSKNGVDYVVILPLRVRP